MAMPERARERYQLKIELVEEAVPPRSPASVAEKLVLSLASDKVWRRYRLLYDPPEPPERVVTVIERSTGAMLLRFAVPDGDEAAKYVADMHYAYKRDQADDWFTVWVTEGRT